MVELQPSKLAMRVRSPSPALGTAPRERPQEWRWIDDDHAESPHHGARSHHSPPASLCRLVFLINASTISFVLLLDALGALASVIGVNRSDSEGAGGRLRTPSVYSGFDALAIIVLRLRGSRRRATPVLGLTELPRLPPGRYGEHLTQRSTHQDDGSLPTRLEGCGGCRG